MSLRELYQEMIVDHGKAPRNVGKLETATHSHAGHNPLCGDKLILYVLEKNGMVEVVQFEGSGCAISMASASILTEMTKGKSIADIEKLFGSFHELVTLGSSADESLGKLVAFSGVSEFPIRVKCATLAWHTLKAALENNPHPVTTE